MFSNAQNVIFYNGTFTNAPHHQGSVLSGLEILQRHVCPDALHDSLERSNSPKCHPETRTAVLKDILSWVRDEASETQVLWLHGPAGAGKTAICYSIAEMSRDQFAAGFFFSRTAAGKNLTATIAYQLLQSIPEARSFIEAAATKDPLIFTRSLNSQIRHLIVEPLKQMLAGPHNPSFPRLIVIDGLNECSPQESQTNILTAIQIAFKQDSFPFRILICSRAEPNICDIFKSKLADSTRRICLDNKYEPDIDIALYLRCRFSEIVRKHRRNPLPLPSPWPSARAIQTLVSRASGQFIYAATVIGYVDVLHERLGPDDRLKIVLGLSGSQSSNPFAELDELFQDIFRAAEDKTLTSHLLGALLLLKTPLPVASLENLLRLQPGDAERALCHLHSVVQMPNDINDHASGHYIGLYHASLGDFLFNSHRAGVYHIKMESAHATLAKSCLRKISESALIHDNMIHKWLARDPAAEYAWHNWIHHFLNVFCWNDELIQEFRKLPPDVLLAWLTRNRRSIDEPLRDLRSILDQFNKLKSWFIAQDTNHKPDGLLLATLCRNVLDSFFRNAWVDILGDSPQNVALSLGILAVVLKPGSVSSASLATLFKLDWVGFVHATFLIRPYINFGTSVDVACSAFSEFISLPEHVSEFNPNKPDIHADLVIRCVECISSHPPQDKQIWQLDPEGAYQYSLANWKDHLRQASSRRLLDYAYEVITRLGHRPTCTHEDPCDILCEADKIVRCIESTIIVATSLPYMSLTSDIKLLELLKEIIAFKYLDTVLFSEVRTRFQEWSSEYKLSMSRTQVRPSSSSAIRRTISSLTASNSSTVDQDYEDVPSSRTQLEVHIGPSTGRAITGIDVSTFISSLTSNASPVRQDHQYTLSSRTSQVYFGASSPIIGTRFSDFVSSIGASNSSTFHCNYRYASSLWKDHLRHANSSRLLETPRASTCICLSELVSAPTGQASSMLTPDDSASLVIRVIECIAAHHFPIDSEADQFVREQTLNFDSAGEYRDALFQWRNHLHLANSRQLLSYAYQTAYVINVRSGYQSICAHRDTRCDLFCEINKTIQCIESRIIEGEFFPQTLSVTDTKILKLLREIIDVKYLQNPQFTSINSRIQGWSADYRLTITRTLS